MEPPASLTEAASRRLDSFFFLSSPMVYKTCPSVQIPVIASFSLFIKCKILQFLRIIFCKCTIQLYPGLHDQNINYFNPSILSYVKHYIIGCLLIEEQLIIALWQKVTHHTWYILFDNVILISFFFFKWCVGDTIHICMS